MRDCHEGSTFGPAVQSRSPGHVSPTTKFFSLLKTLQRNQEEWSHPKTDETAKVQKLWKEWTSSHSPGNSSAHGKLNKDSKTSSEMHPNGLAQVHLFQCNAQELLLNHLDSSLKSAPCLDVFGFSILDWTPPWSTTCKKTNWYRTWTKQQFPNFSGLFVGYYVFHCFPTDDDPVNP